MKKVQKSLAALAACALLALPLTASADWTEGAENRFYTEGGTVAARVSLTTQQSLRVAVSPDEGTASFYFLYGDDAEEESFALQLPCLVQQGAEPSALVSVLPVVDTGNGKRFYMIDTGVPAGCLIVSYSGGKYQTAFDASSVAGDWTEASIEVQEEELVLHLTDAAGTTQDYLLKYDRKSNTFSTEDAASVSTVVIDRTAE